MTAVLARVLLRHRLWSDALGVLSPDRGAAPSPPLPPPPPALQCAIAGVHAVSGNWCESLRTECRADGVRVVTIAPGYIDTPLTRQNAYRMPFLMSPEAFAARALDAIDRGVSFRVIPWQMGVVARVLRVLPDWLYDRLIAGRPRKARQGQ